MFPCALGRKGRCITSRERRTIDSYLKERNVALNGLVAEMPQACRKDPYGCLRFTALGTKMTFLKNAYAPLAPILWARKPKMWLSTIDIAEACDKLEANCSYFDFLGVFPADWDEHLNMSQFKMAKYKNGPNCFGVVFNTDYSYESGQHWVAMFCDYDKIIYYDPKADPPQVDFLSFINTVKRQNKNIKVLVNKCPHQKENTECGIYAIHFLKEMASAFCDQKIYKNLKPMEEQFSCDTKRLSDSDMFKFRKKYFYHGRA